MSYITTEGRSEYYLSWKLVASLEKTDAIKDSPGNRNTAMVTAPRCYAQGMSQERPDGASQVDEFVAILKSKIPLLEHGALESRMEELLNDPSADSDDVILILRQEFDPGHAENN